ncbi:MAG: tetratricopeptide repeat protein, partial [Candidatus Solibacter sp.]|nr:tetratricopeptide repeat protein [Candidatus Solibacter sp.]
MRFLLAAILFLSGCGLRPERLDALFDAASDGLRAGELTKAQLAAEHGIASAASRRDLVYQWKFRLLRCEVLLYSRRAGEVLNQLREDVPPKPEFEALAARKMMMEAWAMSTTGRADEGEALLGAAHRAAEAARAEDVLLDIEPLQGSRLILRRRYDEAEVVLRAALARVPAVHSAYSEAGVQVNLGAIRFERRRYDEAIPYFERAAALAGPRSRMLYSRARSNLATCYSQLGEYDRAIQIHLQSVALDERFGAKSLLETSLAETGGTYMMKADPRTALPYLERALILARESKIAGNAAIRAGNLSSCYGDLRDWQKAASFNQEAIRAKTAA